MNVFVMNAGSSSIKAEYYEAFTTEVEVRPAWSGRVSWTTVPASAQLEWVSATQTGSVSVEVEVDGSAATAVIEALRQSVRTVPDIVGHRVAHGMSESNCSFVDARVRGLIESAAVLAPLHNPAALAGIDAVAAAFPNVPQAAAFDTAFHTTLSPAAAAYAGPYDWFASRGWRRYGFHGISHSHCARRTAEILAVESHGLRMVSAHLGNGCSLAAIVHGRSVDTTMGFTPLEGLMMGSRSGSVDPGLLLYLINSGVYSAVELDRILNHESGLAGISQVSEDIRDVIASANSGAAPAQLALDMYVHRVTAGIAAMAAAAGGLDALAFTGGVGENSAYVRGRVCERLVFLGIEPLGAEAANGDSDRKISGPESSVAVVVVRAREEYAIAREVAQLLSDTEAAAGALASA